VNIGMFWYFIAFMFIILRIQIQASSGDLSSQADVVIKVTDENDNRPVLNDFFIVVTNDERSPPPSVLPPIPALYVYS
jgi:hypothetical protein